MDLYCPSCGEPWDHDSLHEEAGQRYTVPFYANEDDRRAYRRNPAYDADAYAKVFAEVSREFRTIGCGALANLGAKPCTPRQRVLEPSDPDDHGDRGMRAAAAGAMYELLGDDLDGAASMLEDLSL